MFMADRSTPWNKQLPMWRDIKGLEDQVALEINPAPNEGRESVYLADKRVQIGPEVGRLVVDHVIHKLHNRTYEFLHVISAQPDELITVERIITDLYGWDPVTAHHRKELLPSIQSHLSVIHRALGEELGDTEWGAIRTVFKENNPASGTLGYLAVSSV
jgi:hypothetical protein